MMRSRGGYRKGISYYLARYVEPATCRVPTGKTVVQYLRARSFALNSANAFLLSFPKCGRTWLRLTLGKIFALRYRLGDVNLLRLSQMARLHPAIPAISVLHDDHPQWKTAGELLTSKDEYRNRNVILLVRDPRDVVVSQYFEKTRRTMEYGGELSAFLRHDRGSLNTIIAYYNIWARNTGAPSSFLLVRYEDLHLDVNRRVREVLDFLGLDDIDDATLQAATEFSSFTNMRKMEERAAFDSFVLRPGHVNDRNSYKVRQGKVGSFREYVKDDDLLFLNRKVRAELSEFYGYV